MTSTYTQWCNENESRSYPLADDATGELPPDIIVDLSITIPETRSTLWVSSVRITTALITVCISDSYGGILIGTYQRSSVAPYKAYPLVPMVDDVTGWITFGNHAATDQETYRFTNPAQGLIEMRCVRVIDSLPVTDLVKYGAYTSTPLSDIIKIEGGSGVVITAGADGESVVIKLKPELARTISGPAVADADTCGVPPVRRICGVEGDANGNINLVFE